MKKGARAEPTASLKVKHLRGNIFSITSIRKDTKDCLLNAIFCHGTIVMFADSCKVQGSFPKPTSKVTRQLTTHPKRRQVRFQNLKIKHAS